MYFNKKIIYIAENADWVVRWEGDNITRYLNSEFKINSCVFDISDLRTLSRFKNKILHFGSRSTFLPDNYKLVDKSNKMIFTWFHGADEDIEYIRALPEGSKNAEVIHTACAMSKKKLINWGAEENKITVIPLGIDLSLFGPAKDNEKNDIRDEIGIPKDSICIGSFQKDGNGWGEGNTPKLVKGPDIFCDVIGKLSKKYPIFVLLTGPARGYVKNRLKDYKIDFKHVFLNNYSDIPKYYKALDYYIISSRVEGGPKALLECFAAGIPFATTRVGMVDDIIIDEKNSLISEIEDINGLYNNIIRIIEDKELKKKLIRNGFETASRYGWSKIAPQYFNKIYSKLL